MSQTNRLTLPSAILNPPQCLTLDGCGRRGVRRVVRLIASVAAVAARAKVQLKTSR